VEIIRVLRIVEYVGERAWVERTVAKSIHGTHQIDNNNKINAATVGAYPDILNVIDGSLIKEAKL